MLKREQVPKKARLLLARLEQYVMWLDYNNLPMQSLLELHPQNQIPQLPRCSVLGLCPLPIA